MATTNSTKRIPCPKDLTGQVFGRWTVLGFHSVKTGGKRYWLCRCECGTEKPVCGCHLRSGASTGCLRHNQETHGKSHTPEYYAWHNMLGRCRNPNHPLYPAYGGRGVYVCDKWKAFEAFFSDIGPRPSRRHSLDRIDNSGNYEPGNVKWSTSRQQTRNTRRTHLISHDGKVMCLTDWANTTGVAVSTLRNRLKRGIPMEQALQPY